MSRETAINLIRTYAAEDGPHNQARAQRVYIERRLVGYTAFIKAARAGWAIFERNRAMTNPVVDHQSRSVSDK